MRPILLQNITARNSGEQWVVGRVGEAFEGKWKRRCIFIEGWCETEDEARALAHRLEHP